MSNLSPFHSDAPWAALCASHTKGIQSTPPILLRDGDKRSTIDGQPTTPLQWQILHPALTKPPRNESIHTSRLFQANSPCSLTPSVTLAISQQTSIHFGNKEANVSTTSPLVLPSETFTIQDTEVPARATGTIDVKQNMTTLQMEQEPSSVQRTGRYNPKGYRKFLLHYNDTPTNQKKLSYFQGAGQSYDLQDAWGHTLESIETNSTFHIFLQNPNGLSLYDSNFSLIQDLDTCQKYGAYGAALISLPETNVN
jgi:hypothetical protein